MKKLILLASIFLCILYANDDPIIIIYNNSAQPLTKPVQTETIKLPKPAVVFEVNPKITTEQKTVIPINNPEEEEEVVEDIVTQTHFQEEIMFMPTSKTTYSYDEMNCSLEFPSSWELDTTSSDYRLVASPANGDKVFVTLKAYIASETITANTVFQYRGGAVWDRWHMLVSKVFNTKESFLVGVKEKISAVYKKQDLTERLTFKNTIAADDIYVKGSNSIYIVTAQAPEEVWMKYNQTIKDIMNSFYVSEVINGKKL
ncbi:MAG: hypothetical protein PHF25_03170 [Candidatus Margulisbacteria bacterium]|nr:hypothetical protein [Candidatus Margulisiibacteriota bacterium]